MPKIDIEPLPVLTGSGYPAPHDQPCLARSRKRLGEGAGLSQFGMNLMTLKPGGWSSQPHWHTDEDEFVWIVEGEVVLVSDDGEQLLEAGDCAGFPAAAAAGRHLQNRTERDVLLLEVGSRRPEDDHCEYPDLDMKVGPDSVYRRRDGTAYPQKG
jgi:uncharacterized cupin superfamily protein